jgi:hypothetical protein
MKLRKLNNGYYSLYDSDGDIVASNNPNTPCSKRLSKQNCDEIFGGVDVELLACDECHIHIDAYKFIQTLKSGHSKSELQLESKVRGYIMGFNKAMEIQKDKLFTVEDMKKAFEAGYETLESEKTYNEHYDILIQSLQQPKEIEVEIVVHVDLAATPTDSRHPDAYLGTDTGIPFLDENGCLILKKK